MMIDCRGAEPATHKRMKDLMREIFDQGEPMKEAEKEVNQNQYSITRAKNGWMLAIVAGYGCASPAPYVFTSAKSLGRHIEKHFDKSKVNPCGKK